MNLIIKLKISVFFTFLWVNIFAMETVIRYEGTGKMGPWITFSKGDYTCTKFTDYGKYYCYKTWRQGNIHREEKIENEWFYRLATEYVEQEKQKTEKKSTSEAVNESPLIEATTGNVSGINTAGIAAAQNIGYRIPYDIPESFVSKIIKSNPDDYNKARAIADLLLGENFCINSAGISDPASTLKQTQLTSIPGIFAAGEIADPCYLKADISRY